MGTVDSYLELAQRPNTERSYTAAVRHFETEWHGLLPATPQAIAEYLAAFASTLSVNTLQVRLAGLSRWHREYGFQDPTKSTLVKRVLKGIRTAHNKPERQARPIEFERLEQVCAWLDAELRRLDDADDRGPQRLRRTRDQAMLLIGFWRGFRADELTSLSFEHVTVRPGVDMSCYIPHSKTDRNSTGRSFECPALSKLCPVAAYERWRHACGRSEGAVFQRIDRWGNLSGQAMAGGSIVPWLRDLFADAGVHEAGRYSSHSLRRGFANWAKSSGWDIKELMQYVGWKDVNSALRYLDRNEDDLACRFEQGLDRGARAGRRSDAHRQDPRGANAALGANVVPLSPRRT